MTDDAVEEDKTKYTTFWNEFGKAIKLGVIEDTANRNRLAKLIRFHTSKSPDKLTSLEDYISRKKEGQKTIYYLIGTSLTNTQYYPINTCKCWERLKLNPLCRAHRSCPQISLFVRGHSLVKRHICLTESYLC